MAGIRMVGGRLAAFVAVCGVVGLLAAACSSGEDAGMAGGGEGGGTVAEATGGDGATYDESQGYAAQSASGRSAALAAPALQTAEQRVIKTAELELEVAASDFATAERAIRDVARRLDGLVQSAAIDDTGDRSGTLAIRVPSASFEAALNELDAIGDVKRQVIEGEDVGEEFVDLQARLRNGQAQERVLLRLMDQADTVKASIRVQRELERVQQGIEQLQGRLRFLADQTSLSTITVELREAGAEPARVGTLGRAWDEAVDAFFTVISAVVVGAGFVLPMALFALLVALVVRRVRPRLRAQ